MASVSYQLTPGVEASGANGIGFAEDAIVLGTAAPTNPGTIELRVDIVNTPTEQDILMVLKAFVRRIEGARYTDFQSV